MESIAVTIPETPYLLCDSKLVNTLIPLLLCKISSGLFVLMEFLIVKTVTGNNLLPSVVLKISERIDKLAEMCKETIVRFRTIPPLIMRRYPPTRLNDNLLFLVGNIANFSDCKSTK